MPDKRIEFDKTKMELIINEVVSVGVFEILPNIRNISVNKSWFENNIYHLY